MADVRKLLARLNPTSIRYDVGRGGMPELTSIDIAGALGFVKNKLGREVLCHCYWPGGAQLSEQGLDDLLALRMREEMERLRFSRQRADLDLHIAQENIEARRHVSSNDRQELVWCMRRAEAAREEDWPVGPQVYVRIRRAVLDELKEPRCCSNCGGRGEVVENDLVKACEKCDGAGAVAVSDMGRAKTIGVDKSRYSRLWHRPFDWTFALASDASAQAARELWAALRG